MSGLVSSIENAGPASHERALLLPPKFFDFPDPHRPETSYSFRAVLAVLSRHKLLIVACVILLTSASAVSAFLLPSSYAAQAMVILDTRQPEIVQQPAVLSNLVSGSLADPAIVRSEVELISSPYYASRTIERLDLLHSPVFQREMNPKDWTDGLHRAFKAVEDFFAHLRGRPPLGDNVTPMGRAIAAFSRRLTVYNDEHSYAINLRYASEDPAFATKVVNNLAQFYISNQLAFRQELAQKASSWLKQRLTALQAKLLESERQVAEFEQQNHLETVLSGNSTEQRLHELNMQLLSVGDTLARKEAELRQVQDLMKRPDGAAASAEVLSSPLIQKLRQQQAEFASHLAKLREAFNPRFPLGVAQLNEITQQINNEIKRIATSLATEVDAAKMQQHSLQGSISQQQEALDAINRARVQLNQRQQEVAVNRKLYDTFLLRSQQVEEDEQSLDSGARFVPAEEPIEPSNPNKPLLIGFGLSGSLFLGVLLAFLSERLDETVRTPWDSERMAGAPSLGIVPRIRNARGGLAGVVNAPLSAFSESVNNILVALRARTPAGQHQVVTISSAMPHEGKTTFAAALARAAAAADTCTLLIDCDMRHAGVSNLFGDANAPALETMFSQNRTDLAQFVRTDKLSTLTYLPTQRATGGPQRILASRWMKDLIASARLEYDLVIVDTPPLLTVSDAIVLSRLSDTMLLVVRWGRTPAELVAQAVKVLQMHGASSVATVLSMVDIRKYNRGSVSSAYFISDPSRGTVDP